MTSVLLIIFIGFLVVENYRSERKLRNSALAQIKMDIEKRAMALSYFFSERKNDLKDLVESRSLSSFLKIRRSGCQCSMD